MKQIIAMGGGGFSMEPENPLLDSYILNQSPKTRPKVCFLPTASGDAEGYINNFYQSFKNHECEPSHLSLFRPPSRDLEEFIMDKDIIYVGGGNTKNLLALWRDWKLNEYLENAWHNGIILAGVSAGSICWFEEGITDSYGDKLEPLQCLGLLRGSNCPHYDGEADRRPAYQELVASGKIQPGIAADDGVALHYIGQEVNRIVSSRPAAKAFQVFYDNTLVEAELKTEFLGASERDNKVMNE